MLTICPSYADDLLTIAVSGQVTHQDIETILFPAIEAKLMDHACIRLWYEFSADFMGITCRFSIHMRAYFCPTSGNFIR